MLTVEPHKYKEKQENAANVGKL